MTSGVSTRFSTNPVVLIDRTTQRMMAYSQEMHDTFVCINGNWRLGAFSRSDLKSNFVAIKNPNEAWVLFQRALKDIGYI